MLAQHQRRWPNIAPTLGESLVLTGHPLWLSVCREISTAHNTKLNWTWGWGEFHPWHPYCLGLEPSSPGKPWNWQARRVSFNPTLYSIAWGTFAAQSQKAVSANSKGKQILPFGFASGNCNRQLFLPCQPMRASLPLIRPSGVGLIVLYMYSSQIETHYFCIVYYWISYVCSKYNGPLSIIRIDYKVIY